MIITGTKVAAVCCGIGIIASVILIVSSITKGESLDLSHLALLSAPTMGFILSTTDKKDKKGEKENEEKR